MITAYSKPKSPGLRGELFQVKTNKLAELASGTKLIPRKMHKDRRITFEIEVLHKFDGLPHAYAIKNLSDGKTDWMSFEQIQHWFTFENGSRIYFDEMAILRAKLSLRERQLEIAKQYISDCADGDEYKRWLNYRGEM